MLVTKYGLSYYQFEPLSIGLDRLSRNRRTSIRKHLVSLQSRGAEDAMVGATLVVALLVDHQNRGRRTGSERSDATRVAPTAAFPRPQV